jgi:hypothetical protein
MRKYHYEYFVYTNNMGYGKKKIMFCKRNLLRRKKDATPSRICSERGCNQYMTEIGSMIY